MTPRPSGKDILWFLRQERDSRRFRSRLAREERQFQRALRRATEAERRVLVLTRIRSHFRAFGLPVDDLTPDELEAAIMSHCKAIGSTGITAAEAGRALSKALRGSIRDE